MSALSQSQVHPLLGSLSLPGRPLQPHPHSQLEHFLPLRVNSPSPLSLFPNFNKLDPVQKAVINHTFGVCPPKKKPIISCNICHLRFNSTTQAEAHYKGHKHARKLKALETQRNRQKRGRSPSKLSKDKDQDMMMLGGATASSASHLKDITDSHPLEAGTTATSCAPCSELEENPTGGQQEAEEAQEPKSCKKHLHCPTCKVTVNSSLQLEAHCSGSRHKQMLDGGPKGTRPQCRVKLKPSSKPACRMKQRMCSRSRVGLSVSRQPFHCEMCQVSVNSETQLKQHMNSRRHKERLAGKPVKVKLAPFNKLQPSAALVTKLALQKHLYKALPAGFLTSPLNAAAFCTVASGPMALRLPPSPTSIIQSPFISPTLFRPAPGPLRATHTPIIFSPY
ncbi:Zinc finger protein 385B [Takifugu flavidus]|uniref:Zinc finger protein 385B n=1 Tax=Takifugu flavidus TaxID=433684 RepID=A0A5C6PPV1_9TELE|nr:Zinc finger protein 385B [Takifugu flavidus]